MVSYKSVILSMMYNDGADDYAVIQNPTTKKLIICGPIGSSDPEAEQDLAVYPGGEMEMNELSSGQQPISGKHSLYFKTDGRLYTKDDVGEEVLLSGSVKTGQSLQLGMEHVGDTDHAFDDGDFGIRFDNLSQDRTLDLSGVEDGSHHGMIIALVVGALNSYTLNITTTKSVQIGTALTTDYKSYILQYDNTISWWILLASG